MTDPRFVGRRYESAPFEVTEASIREFMQAIGDLAHDRELVAPPTYAMVYGSGPIWQLWSDQEVALDVAHLVHAEQSFRFHRPVQYITGRSESPLVYSCHRPDARHRSNNLVCLHPFAA